MRIMNRVPLLLILIRALLGVVLLLAALLYPSKLIFGAGLLVAFLSDIFDGILARRLNIATANLRRLDSLADTLFYVSATLAAWLLYPNVLREHIGALVLLLMLELTRYVFDYAKFGREASYHMWSSKGWGVFLFLGFFSLLALGQDGVLVALPIYVGIIADIEGLAISVVLRNWRPDVPSIIHALRYRASKHV